MVSFLNEGIEETASKLFELGVGDLVAIHFPEGSYAQSKDGEKVWHGSLALPKGYIKGAAGAGDAFCAGVLFGVHENWSLEKVLAYRYLCGNCLHVGSYLYGWITISRRVPCPCRRIWDWGRRSVKIFHP